MNPTTNTTNTAGVNSYISISNGEAIAEIQSLYSSARLTGAYLTPKEGISPQLYFKYVKKKMGFLENATYKKRMARLEKAFNAAMQNGQKALGEKVFKELTREMRESEMYARGVRMYIDKEVLYRHKSRIKGGHISDTAFSEFTRVIPSDVLKKKAAVDNLFDSFVIFHYWNEEAEKVLAGKQKMSPEERSRMRDPILFGRIHESSRLYFIADWEDEYCDLTFDDIIDVVGGQLDDYKITAHPKLDI